MKDVVQKNLWPLKKNSSKEKRKEKWRQKKFQKWRQKKLEKWRQKIVNIFRIVTCFFCWGMAIDVIKWKWQG
jgi:hypothetical protein